MLKIQLIMMKTVKLLKRNHKNSVDELKVRDTSCPKGKKVEDIQYILEQVQDSSLAKVLVNFKFIEIIQKLFLHKIRILPAGFSACGGSFLRHLSSPFRSDIVALLPKEKLNL